MTTRGGGFVGRVTMGAHSRIQRMKTHVLPFTDHTGKEALMIFSGREVCPLPPLYSFAIYFTHKDVNIENIQPVELLNAIICGTPLQNYPCPFRLEIFFLPTLSEDAASDEACIAHYREEKCSRGDYMRQIEAVDAPGNSTSTGGLPGFVPTYIDNPYGGFHHGRLYNYQGPNWRTDKRPVRRVFFDPITQEEYAPFVEEAGEPEVLPPVRVTLHAMQKSDTEDPGENFVGLTMHETLNGKTQNETDGPWQEAVERGWATW